MNRLKQQWSELRSTFWFLPFLIVLTSIVYAVLLIQADHAGGERWLPRWPRNFGVGVEGARDMLSTLAGSMMTVMDITVSMTLLALALASSQYTSRILRNFMRSPVTQVTLGTFAGIAVLIFFIHHIASSIHASTIIAAMRRFSPTYVSGLFWAFRQ